MNKDDYPKRCTKCGVVVERWERARVHSRDEHGGVRQDMMDIFEPVDEGE